MTETSSTTVAQTEAVVAQPVSPNQAEWLHILHVEDNPADAMLTQEYIRGVMSAVEFDSAVRLGDLTAERAAASDCAILDLSLPDASGLEALIALRALSESLPIIVLTGFDELEVGLSALRFGADDYLIKNHVDGFTLERAVRYAIERRGLVEQATQDAADVAVAIASAIVGEGSVSLDEPSETSSAAAAGQHHVSLALAGTHQVSVRIGEESVAYELTCESCAWEAERGSGDEQSWSARSLDAVLLNHVAFGGHTHPTEETVSSVTDAAAPALAETPGKSATPQKVAARTSTRGEAASEKPVGRRLFFSSPPWKA